MAEAHLDHPGEITWFSGYGPAPVLGPCPHADCPHDRGGAVAYGPDYEHYVLDKCTVPDGCAGQCRAWTAEWPEGEGPNGRRYRLPERSDWKHVPVVTHG